MGGRLSPRTVAMAAGVCESAVEERAVEEPRSSLEKMDTPVCVLLDKSTSSDVSSAVAKIAR